MMAVGTTSAPSPAAQRTGNLTDPDEDSAGSSEDLMIPNQDEAQAVLQPAMSAAASHLTSCHTPAVEKAAALGNLQGGGLFDDSQGLAEADGDTTPEQASSPKSDHPPDKQHLDKAHSRRQRGLPSPWRAQTPHTLTVGHAHSAESRGILGTAFGPSRQRSRSAGQEALKRLQKAFPSLAAPSHFLPSLPTSFLSFTDGKNNRNQGQSNAPPAPRQNHALQALNKARSRTLPREAESISRSPEPPAPVLRRVASDDSLLYNTLSRVSSLGDDDQFMDVREMVSTRLMAIKDSLPDVPNFKMPGLAMLQAASRRSTISLNGIFSNDSSATARSSAEHNATANHNATKDDSTTLDSVLEDLTGDLVVMGGYRGSILRSAEPPHQQLWAPVKVGLNMRKANLELGLSDEDEDKVEQHIIPSGMLQHIGPIDISRKFFKKLRSCENARNGKLRVWDFGYDWRLSPSRLSKRLLDFLQTLPSNQPGVPAEQRGAIVIAHSLGGLITRHAVNQRPELFAGVLYAGVPQRCVNILGPLRDGDAVLFNDKLLTAQVNFSIRTSFALLPDDGFCFLDKNTGEEYPVDFFDPESWVKWHLSPCVAPPLPPHNRQQYPSLTSLLPNSLLGKIEKRSSMPLGPDIGPTMTNIQPPQLTSQTPSPAVEPERLARNMEYLGRTLSSIRQFRRETAHMPSHEAANTYPPFAVIYGKSIPTVYAARVNGREAIACSDAYDDLVFRPGDGVVLAKEAMLPEGYSTVHGGRVRTERGHITMLGDMPALGRALNALVRGRQKGIGLGEVAARNWSDKRQFEQRREFSISI